MSTTSRLWNRNRSDLLPQYRLTYGHIIGESEMTPEEVTRLGKHLELGTLEYCGDLRVDLLPAEAGYRVLSTEQEMHLLIVQVDAHHTIFGPHRLFFRSKPWLDWNRYGSRLMALAHQLGVDEFYYTIFRGDSRILDAVQELDSIRYLEESPIEAYLDGERIYYQPGRKPEPTAEIKALLASDARISEENGALSITAWPSHKPVEQVTHYIFQKSRRRWFSLSR